MVMSLAESVEEMYEVFSSYRRPKTFSACACCWTGNRVDNADVIGRVQVQVFSPGGSHPLRDLSAADLQQVAEHVPVTCGDSDVLRHYLPRLLELVCGEGFDWPELEAVVARMSLTVLDGATAWTQWPPEEVAAVRQWLQSIWRESVLAAESASLADQMWCAIAISDPEIDWYLNEWLTFATPGSANGLHKLLEVNAGYLPHGPLANAYWSATETGKQNQAKFAAWLTSPSTAEAVALAAAHSSNPDEIASLNACLALLAK
jgi:hypothetical protein